MTQNKDITINVLANCPVSSSSMGGGDRIFIELIRNWMRQGLDCTILGCEEAIGMCGKNRLDVRTYIISRYSAERLGVIGAYVGRIIDSVFNRLPIYEDGKVVIIYSASDFLPDIIPVWRLKRKKKDIKWIVGLYLKMPSPFKGGASYSIRALLSYIGQQLSILIMKRYVDMVFVLCHEDIDFLASKGIEREKIIVIWGGVDATLIGDIKVYEKLYDACFIGRFHPQKGLLDLIESWRLVVEQKKDASLVIIGWGDKKIESNVRDRIRLCGLTDNVRLLGFCDGARKYRIMKESRVFVFPSNHESWGIVVLEAIACGIPVVAYDLPVLKRNFQGGIKFVELGNYRQFADAIISVLENSTEYNDLQEKGIDTASKYSWESLADMVSKKLYENLTNFSK